MTETPERTGETRHGDTWDGISEAAATVVCAESGTNGLVVL